MFNTKFVNGTYLGLLGSPLLLEASDDIISHVKLQIEVTVN